MRGRCLALHLVRGLCSRVPSLPARCPRSLSVWQLINYSVYMRWCFVVVISCFYSYLTVASCVLGGWVGTRSWRDPGEGRQTEGREA